MIVNPDAGRLLLRDGTVLDGSGTAPVTADVLVDAGRVAAVGPGLPAPDGVDVVDASGCEVLPGFVDVHSHDDAALFRDGALEPKLQQGVTTTVVGNCGHGCAPSSADTSLEEYARPILGPFPATRFSRFVDYVAAVSATARRLHSVALVPHAPVRAAQLGMTGRPADASERERIAGAMAEALDAGAAGASLGLMYAPGNTADTEELLAIARVVAARGKLLVAHLRNEADLLHESIEEFGALARRTGVALHVSHLKVPGPKNAGRMPRVLEQLDALRNEGVNITADVYPYEAGSTTVATLFPSWATAGGTPSLLKALSDPAGRADVLSTLDEPWSGQLENYFASLGPEAIRLAGFSQPGHEQFEGRALDDIARSRQQDPRDALADLVLAEHGRLTVVLFQTDIEGMKTALAWPHTLIGSDGLPHEQGYVHPRLYGTFSRLLDSYSGPGQPLSRTEAVRRATRDAAHRFGIAERGEIGVGKVADLQLLDPLAYADRATFADPRRSPDGVRAVYVAGTPVVGHRASEGALTGHFVPVTHTDRA